MLRVRSLVVFATLVPGCHPGVGEQLIAERENPWVADQANCSIRPSMSNPLVVEWPAADRGSLERRIKRGVVIVRYAGCSMEVLKRCHIPDLSYRYGGFTLKSEEVRMRNADELYANLPVGAAKLEAKLENADALAVSMTMVGMYEAERDAVAVDELQGDCEGATHIVSGVQVGAYGFFAERELEVSGAVGLRAGPSIKAGTRVERERLSNDGDATRCGGAQAGDLAPPPGCGALIRLEVVPLEESRTVRCPSSMHWTGDRCEATPQLPSREPGVCPVGMVFIPGGEDGGLAVGDYCLDLTEVTAQRYASCVADGACPELEGRVGWRGIKEAEKTSGSLLCNSGRPDRAEHPINCIAWADARAFCRHRGARLPMDEEWEWAARGGSDQRTFPWGNEPPTAARANACGKECRAWFERHGMRRERVAYDADDGAPGTAPVGSRPAGHSRWGPLDLAGNVAEWTATKTKNGKRRIRGGSFWVQSEAWLSNADTIAARPERRDAVIGFRCADDL